jgi:hypothetical protein
MRHTAFTSPCRCSLPGRFALHGVDPLIFLEAHLDPNLRPLSARQQADSRGAREALGNTLSDEFVDVILGKLVEALRPGLYDQLEEATLNAALATIDSMRPRSELQALLAVQIIATGFAGLRFLRQSHRNMTEDSFSP